MSMLKIYRKRIIPDECIELKDDVIVEYTNDRIITKWKTLKPKKEFDHGTSCYFINDGIKVSKFYREDGSLVYWYCDIVDYCFSEDKSTLTVTDLLADVVIYPSGRIKVMDLDELADALDQKLITEQMMSKCLRQLNNLLTMIDRDKFDKYQACLDGKGL